MVSARPRSRLPCSCSGWWCAPLSGEAKDGRLRRRQIRRRGVCFCQQSSSTLFRKSQCPRLLLESSPGCSNDNLGIARRHSKAVVKSQLSLSSVPEFVVGEGQRLGVVAGQCGQGSRRLKPQRRMDRHPGGRTGFNAFWALHSGGPDVWVRSRTRCGVSITVQK